LNFCLSGVLIGKDPIKKKKRKKKLTGCSCPHILNITPDELFTHIERIPCRGNLLL
jgi:hypothetical protein